MKDIVNYIIDRATELRNSGTYDLDIAKKEFKQIIKNIQMNLMQKEHFNFYLNN